MHLSRRCPPVADASVQRPAANARGIFGAIGEYSPHVRASQQSVPRARGRVEYPLLHLVWFSNRYLALAVLGEAVMLAGFLFVAHLATLLGQAPPDAAGFLVAFLAVPWDGAPAGRVQPAPRIAAAPRQGT
jgi:hypothetical protein